MRHCHSKRVLPNGDGKNDRFRVSGLHNIEGVRMQSSIAGQPAFLGSGLRWQRRQDPRDDASEGTYYFILDIPITTEELTVTTVEGTEILEGPTTATYHGHLTLVR